MEWKTEVKNALEYGKGNLAEVALVVMFIAIMKDDRHRQADVYGMRQI